MTAAWVMAVMAVMGRPGSSLERLGVPSRVADPERLRRRGPGRTLAVPAVAAAAVGVLMVPRLRAVLIAAVAVAVLGAARRVLRLGRERRTCRARQRRVVVLCDDLSAELRGGLPMSSVIQRCCRDDAELAPVVHAAALGGDIASSLRSCARLPGAEGLRAVAAAWDVAGTTGSALSGVLDRMAAALRGEEEARAEVEAALGPPRATARLLAVLPLFGLALGTSIGAHPVGFLVSTPTGLACLCAGVALALLGIWWVERLAAAAEV